MDLVIVFPEGELTSSGAEVTAWIEQVHGAEFIGHRSRGSKSLRDDRCLYVLASGTDLADLAHGLNSGWGKQIVYAMVGSDKLKSFHNLSHRYFSEPT